ncbi:MAG TPA: hypothetical protein VLU95_05465, partial [Candidatus Acidoferrum sp.]|nr:hypothetical protein [Candidatus Acidoferrum sp.]
MKIRIIKLTPESIIQMLQGKLSTLASNLPGDAELLDIKLDLFAKQVSLIVRSDSFDDVAETIPIPEFNLINTQGAKVALKSTVSLK